MIGLLLVCMVAEGFWRLVGVVFEILKLALLRRLLCCCHLDRGVVKGGPSGPSFLAPLMSRCQDLPRCQTRSRRDQGALQRSRKLLDMEGETGVCIQDDVDVVERKIHTRLMRARSLQPSPFCKSRAARTTDRIVSSQSMPHWERIVSYSDRSEEMCRMRPDL